MCDYDPKNEGRRLDPCMETEISALQASGVETLACCCGHGVYPKTIVALVNGEALEMMSGVEIPRKRRFYRRDQDGLYFIPEIQEARP